MGVEEKIRHWDSLEVLEPLNVETRYPTEKEKLLASLDYERCAGIVAETKRCVAWLRMLYIQ
jgi:hypothetical protein